MPYAPQTWTDAPSETTPISAARLGHMETGIDDATATADAASSAITLHIASSSAHPAASVTVDTSDYENSGGTEAQQVLDDFDSAITAAHAAGTSAALDAAASRARATHTGTQTASTISDFSEAVDDRVISLLVEGSGISLTYDDGANTLTISSSGGSGNVPNGTVTGQIPVWNDSTGEYEAVTPSPAAAEDITVDDSGWTELSGADAQAAFDSADAAIAGLAGAGVADGDKGDITVSSSGTVWTVDNDAITLAKMANIATDRLIGRDTASTGDPEVITVGGGIEFTGSGGIQTSAFTGDVTKSAGGTALTVANDAVTYAKMQNVSATDRILGRSTAGAGDVEEITCTSTARSLLDDSSTSAMRTTLGLVIGTDVAAIASPTFTGTPAAPTASAGTSTTQLATTAFVQTEKNVGVPADKTADYTLVLGDAHTSIGVDSGTAKNVTVPLNSSVAYATGTVVEVRQVGAGQVTIVATGGVTLRSPGGALKTRVQYSAASLLKVATDTWSVQGDLTT